MGPLFSAALVALVLLAAFVVALLVLLCFMRPATAVLCAGAFALGASGGAALSVAVLALFVGFGADLVSSSQVVAYLASVAVGSLVSGVSLSWLVVRMRSNPSLKRTCLRHAA